MIDVPSWLRLAMERAASARGRRVGAGIRSKLFAQHHEVRRRLGSKYPDAVSIEKTERRKLERRKGSRGP